MQDKAVEPGRRADPDDSGFGDEAGHRNWPEWLAAARTAADLTADPVAPTASAQLEQMLDGRDLDSPTLGTRDRAGYGGGVNFSDADGPSTPKPRRGGAVDWPRSPGLPDAPSHLDAHCGDPNDLHWLAEGPLPPSPRRQPTYQQFGWR